MAWRKTIRRAAACAVLLAAILAGQGCAKRRPVPVPPPGAPAPRATAPPSSASPSPPSAALAPPEGCSEGPRPPWVQCVYERPTGESLVYYLALPEAAPEGLLLPVITVLHGSSGSGPGDNKALLGGHRFATDLWVRPDVHARHPSIVLVPQANPPPGETWVRVWRAPSPGDPRPKEALALTMEVIADLQRRYPVDARRLYLTGQSMGGFGAWLAYTRYPGRFAAIVPVAGGGDAASVVPNPTAVWAFHGVRDAVVPVSRARQMVAAIEAAASPVRYREYPGLGHKIFEQAYGEPDLVEWLYSQSLPAESAPDRTTGSAQEP